MVAYSKPQLRRLGLGLDIVIFETLCYLCLPLRYLSLSLITNYDLLLDMLNSTSDSTFYIVELGVGFETNINNIASRMFATFRVTCHQNMVTANLSTCPRVVLESLDSLTICSFRCAAT